MADTFPELVSNGLPFAALVDLYLRSLTRLTEHHKGNCPREIADVILLARFFGFSGYAEEVLRDTLQILPQLPWAAKRDEWLKEIDDLSASPEVMNQNLQAELQAHRLTRVPEYPVDGLGSPVRFIEACRRDWGV